MSTQKPTIVERIGDGSHTFYLDGVMVGDVSRPDDVSNLTVRRGNLRWYGTVKQPDTRDYKPTGKKAEILPDVRKRLREVYGAKIRRT